VDLSALELFLDEWCGGRLKKHGRDECKAKAKVKVKVKVKAKVKVEVKVKVKVKVKVEVNKVMLLVCIPAL
jgi:hypothetical protein